ncbi:MAG: AAA family ATPase [Oscillospiraceae bacterium]|nr:AAA family ATPase [Oscillospiraceae bacterium]
MGRYIDPGNDGFRLLSQKNYVDKTGVIGLINDRIGTNECLICISRPRRFGKSYAAKTVCAYYDCSVDSHELFDRYTLSDSPSYEEHINKYNVISLDMTEIISTHGAGTEKANDLIKDLCTEIKDEVCSVYSQIDSDGSIFKVLYDYVSISKRKIVFVIDEWDAIIREFSKDEALQKRYIDLLRGLFKNGNFTPTCIAAAYMTGILPIKKDKGQSALSDFKEYTVLTPGKFAGYIGFREDEVKALCDKTNMGFEQMKWWYDGYSFGRIGDIYNPYSVMTAIDQQSFGSYWKKTSAAESLQTYVDMDYEGLQGDIEKLIKGAEIIVDTDNFKNDLANFSTKDDILTLLIHLGYLTYDSENRLARIPNEELRSEFRSMLKTVRSPELMKLVSTSKQILEDTLTGNCDNIAGAFDELCETNYAPTFYNNEQSLRSMVRLAYLAAVDRYIKVEELPSGKGLADIVYIPQRYSPEPALVVELKWNRSAESALDQIHERNYPAVLKNYGGEILLVGINYDTKEKKHICKIERIEK